MGFFTNGNGGSATVLYRKVAIPFRVGWGFSLDELRLLWKELKQVAIPFRVGWGFSLKEYHEEKPWAWMVSQSLSGWDGVFHRVLVSSLPQFDALVSQSLSGWDGFFSPAG